LFKLCLDKAGDRLKTVLCLGAHSDDIEIGCGGFLLRLVQAYPQISVHWVVLSSSDQRVAEARHSSELFLAHVRHKNIIIKEFRTSFLPFIGSEVKNFFEELKSSIDPDLVLTHYRGDLHQDHRLASDLTWNTFRDHLIFEYEIPKYDGDFGQPNVFVPLEEALCNQKIDYLFECFRSQSDKPWFKRDLFLAVLRLRGMESNAPSGYAEAFYCRKGLLAI
jgi:LmbE family N-acetylglucosaminyl deacetylase